MSKNLMDTSNEFARRSEDEHFGSFAEAKEHADRVRDESTEHEVAAGAIEFEAGENGGFRVTIPGHRGLRPTAFFTERLASEMKTSTDFLATLKPETLTAALNEGWAKTRAADATMNLLARPCVEGGREVRCMTTGRYGRVFDAEILDAVDRWLLPAGYKAATPTINTSFARRNEDGTMKPALFAGDRSSHFLFNAELPKRDDGFGGIRRGFMISNSEVGARALEWKTFYFRDLCANFIIWNASEVKGKKVRHMIQAVADARQELQTVMCGLSNEVEPVVYDTMARAQTTPFVVGKGDGQRRELALEKLRRVYDLTLKRSELALFSAALPENMAQDNPWSVWSVAQGVTSAAKAEKWSDDMVEMSEIGGRILATAAAS